MPEPLGKLKCLKLHQCGLRGNQLSKFAPHSPPCLNIIELCDLRGVINSDLLTLLIAVAPTLANLSIIDCEIQRHNSDEEHATDATVSGMVNLQTLSLAGDCGTALSIARGHTPPRITRPPLQYPSIFISHVPAIDFQSLRKALEVTGWASVMVMSEAIREAPEDVREELQDIASERDIALTID